MLNSLTIRIIFLFSLLCAAAAGGLGMRYRAEVARALAVRDVSAAGAKLVADFTHFNGPLAILPSPLEDVNGGARELVDPVTALPQSFAYDAALIRYVAKYQETCHTYDGTDEHRIALLTAIDRNPALLKALRWAKFICGAAPEPEESYFAVPPFMHPSGRSYVALARAVPSPRFSDMGWRKRMGYLQHVLERGSESGGKPEQAAARGELQRLGRTATAAMLRGEAAVLAPDRFVILRRASEGNASFAVYSRAAWDLFAKGANVALIERTTATKCGVGNETFCWIVPSATALRRTTPVATAALVALALAVLGFIASGSLRWWTVKKLQAERLKMVRLLAHELRTPATSLALTVDALRDTFESLPEAAQEAFLRISSDAERMKRVVATSARFLGQKTQTKAERAANERNLVSIREYLGALVEQVERRHGGKKVEIKLPGGDFGIRLDAAWLELAITNLVDNALRHGRAPVSVEATPNGKGFVISVRDVGTLTPSTERASERSGLGFGLMVVEDAAEALNAKLSRTINPTTFMLTFKHGATE